MRMILRILIQLLLFHLMNQVLMHHFFKLTKKKINWVRVNLERLAYQMIKPINKKLPNRIIKILSISYEKARLLMKMIWWFNKSKKSKLKILLYKKNTLHTKIYSIAHQPRYYGKQMQLWQSFWIKFVAMLNGN